MRRVLGLLGDVFRDACHPNRLASIVRESTSAAAYPSDGPIRTADPELDYRRGRLAERPVDVGLDLGAIGREDAIHDVLERRVEPFGLDAEDGVHPRRPEDLARGHVPVPGSQFRGRDGDGDRVLSC